MEIYGIVDQAVTNTTTKFSSDEGNLKLSQKSTGTQSGLATQRIGFRGTEDLGGGLKGLFQIESALTAGGSDAISSTTSNTFGSRPTFVGLSGSFGTVTLGRQDTPLLKAVVPQLAGGANNMVGQLMWSSFGTGVANVIDTMGAISGLPSSTTYTSDKIADIGAGRIARQTTINRAINYATPTFNGFKAELQIGQNDAKLTGSDITTTVNSKTDDTGLNVQYANGPLTLAAAHHTQKMVTDGANAGKNTNNYAGATYNLGFANVSLQYGESKRTVEAGEVYKNKGTQLGAQVPVSASTALFASYGLGKRTIMSEAELKQTSMQLGATYSFSKRTKVYAAYGQQELKGDNAATTGVKFTENQFGLGVNHSF